MNCLFETVASMWLVTLKTIKRGVPDADDDAVQENLEGCRMSLEVREAELAESCKKLGRDALRRKQQGDIVGAKTKLMERKRSIKRLEKLRNSLTLVDTQLDALRNTELDRELMQTLVASSAALKKAGVGKGVKEAEAVMSELDEQMRESSDLTQVLSNNIQDDTDFDMDEEFELLMSEEKDLAITESKTAIPETINMIDMTPPMQTRVPDVPQQEEVAYAPVLSPPWYQRQQHQQFVRAI
jgi:LmbE family N-acetylglucosaminyl deacetylase